MKPVFGGFKTRLKFIKFGHGLHKTMIQTSIGLDTDKYGLEKVPTKPLCYYLCKRFDIICELYSIVHAARYPWLLKISYIRLSNIYLQLYKFKI